MIEILTPIPQSPFLDAPSYGCDPTEFFQLRSDAGRINTHATIGAYFVTKGWVDFTINQIRTVKCNTNRFIIADADVLLSYGIVGVESGQVRIFYFNKDVLSRNSLEGAPAFPLMYPLKWGMYNIENSGFGRILKPLINLPQDEALEQIWSNCSVISRELHQHLSEEVRLISRVPSAKQTTQRELYEKVRTGKEYILNNLTNDISLDHMAMEAGMSKFHFARCFTSVFSITPHKYLLEERLKESMRLLESKMLSLPEIAIRFQFSDYAHFSNHFKKYFGFSPSHVYKT